MKTFYTYLLTIIAGVLLSTTVLAASYTTQFTGRIIDGNTDTSQTTAIASYTTNGVLTYVVYSKITGSSLATFHSLSEATQFIAQLDPSIPYTH